MLLTSTVDVIHIRAIVCRSVSEPDGDREQREIVQHDQESVTSTVNDVPTGFSRRDSNDSSPHSMMKGYKPLTHAIHTWRELLAINWIF
jgi:hypothetical protein